MRWKLIVLLGLLASGAAAAALVRGQDATSYNSTFGGATSLRSRPTPAAPADASSPFRASGRSGLAERLQQARQTVVEDYNADGGAPGLLQPMPESGEPTPPPEPAISAQTTAAGLPSVLKREASRPDAPQVRTAAMDKPSQIRGTSPAAAPLTSAPTPGATTLAPPSGARPLGSPPPGARQLGSPPPGTAAPATASDENTPPTNTTEGELTPPPFLGDAGNDIGSSRRRPLGTATPSTPSTNVPGGSASPATDSPSFRAAMSGRDTIMVGAAPQLRLETVGPQAVVRGRPTPYTMVISNTGDAAARGVEVHIHSHASVDLAIGQATHGGAELRRNPAGGSSLVWTISELPRSARAELTVSVVTRENRPFELGATWTCAAQAAAAPIEVLEPQLAMTLSGPKDVMYGETKIYTIILTNPGTGDVDNVMLALAPIGSDQEAPPPRNIGSLRAGERKEIPIQLTAREAGMLHIHAQATADGGLQAEAAEKVIVRRAQIQLAVQGPPLKYAGTSAEYQVRISNTGNAPAEDLHVAASLPSGVDYVPGNDGGTPESGGIGWRVGSLAPGDERTITFSCTMREEGAKRFALQARGAGGLQATAAVATTVEALADLKLEVNDPPGPIAIGKEVVYEVRILNRGTKAAAGIEIAGYFSEGIEPTSVEGLQCELGSGQVTAAPVASLPAGGEIVVRIKAKADRPGNHIFRAVVQCTDPETRLATEETTRFFDNAQPAAEGPSLSQQPSAFQPVTR